MPDRLRTFANNWPQDIPFERAVRQRLDELDRFVGKGGLTWSAIAGALTQAGLRRKNGLPLSSRQMNTVFLRVKKAMPKNTIANPPIEGNKNLTTVQGVDIRTSGSQTSPDHALVDIGKGLGERLAEASRMSDRSRSSFDD